jgi:hypothetical protein
MAAKKESRPRSDGQDAVFSLERVANPLPHGTFGDLGAFFQVRADRPFTNTRLEIPYSRVRARKVIEETLRLFWWDEERSSLVLVSSSGVDSAKRKVWGRIGKPGIYGAIGLPADPNILRTVAAFSLFLAEELRSSPDLQPRVCGLILCPNPLDGPFEGPGNLCDLCLGLDVPELHLPEVQILRDHPGLLEWQPLPPVGPTPPWPGWQHDSRKTSQSAFDGPARMPQIAWSFAIAGGGFASTPVVGTDGTVYFYAGNSAVGIDLHALEGRSGAHKWSVQLTPPSPYLYGLESVAAPAIGPDGTIYVNDIDGSLHAVSATGTIPRPGIVQRPICVGRGRRRPGSCFGLESY